METKAIEHEGQVCMVPKAERRRGSARHADAHVCIALSYSSTTMTVTLSWHLTDCTAVLSSAAAIASALPASGHESQISA